MNWIFAGGIYLLIAGIAQAARPHVSDDRDLKEIDLTQWDCLDRLEGSAKTADGVERNRLKNRSAPEGGPAAAEPTDSAGFLKRIAQFEVETKGTRRKALSPAQKQQLDALEKQIVSMTGYLGLAYCGPPETTNCGSGDYHDWHLELFEKPIEHSPQPGDATPIICEITPRTQNAIFHDGIRLQDLAAFFRKSDLTYESTGHPARKIRVTGYLLWDDEHNGTADVGTAVHSMGANKFHNPWRSIAWEIHPVLKLQRMETASAEAPVAPSPVAAPSAAPSPAEPANDSPPLVSPTPPQILTVLQPVQIKIPYGQVTLPAGAKLHVLSRNAQSAMIEYMGGTYAVPIGSTDLR